MANTYSIAEMRAYLLDELSDLERRRMDAAILSDPLLAGAMEALEDEMTTNDRSADELMKLTASFREAIPGQQQELAQPFSGKMYYRYAAAFLLLMAAGWTIWNFAGGRDSVDAQTLYAENFSPYEDVLSQRSSDGQEAALTETLGYYNGGNYVQALVGFEKIMGENRNDPFVLLYAANSALELKKTSTAIIYLEKLEAQKNPVLHDISKWYLAMAALQTGDKEGAEVWLTELVKTNSFYAGKAKELLSKI